MCRPSLLPQFAPCAGDALAGEETAQRKAPKSYNQLRVNQLDLAVQVLLAGCDFRRFRVPVVWRAALHHVGDKHVVAVSAYGRQQTLQQLPGRAYEGASLPVFMEAGPFADEHQLCPRTALAGDCVGAAPVQWTIGAIANCLRHFLQAVHGLAASGVDALTLTLSQGERGLCERGGLVVFDSAAFQISHRIAHRGDVAGVFVGNFQWALLIGKLFL